MALAILQLSQPGASITLADDVSGDLSSVENSGGLAHPITITAVMTGGVVADECDFTLTLRDVPLNAADDTDAVSTLANPTRNTWTLVLDAACWGALVIELTVTRLGVTDTTTRRYNFRSPIRALAIPGNAEVIDGRAGRSRYGGVINRRSWYSTTPTAPPSGYTSVFRDFAKQIDAAGTIPISALNFYARRGSGAAGSISATNAYQEILGRGKEYTLSMFGWTSGDIATAFQAAVTAAAAAGGGTVRLPAGEYLCSAQITVPTVVPTVAEKGVKIRGAGFGATTIQWINPTSGIYFDGNASGGGRHLYGSGVSDLTMVGSGTGGAGKNGITLREAIFCQVTNVWVRSFADAQLLITDGGNTCQDIYLENLHLQAGGTGLRCTRVAQSTWVNLMCNQNTVSGLEISNSQGLVICGGLIQQPASSQPIWFKSFGGVLSPDVSFIGPIYFEITADTTKAVVRADNPTSFSVVNFIGGLVGQGGDAVQPFLDFTGNYSLFVSGRMFAQGWPHHIKARTLGGFVGIGLQATSSLYDFDASSAAKATWICEGTIHCGTAAPAAGSSTFAHPVKPGTWTTGTRPTLPGIGYNSTLGRMEFSIDGSVWRKFAEEA